MESFIFGESQVPAPSSRPNQPAARSADSQFRPDATVGVSRSDKQIKSPQPKNARRLISDQQYFGLEAGVLRAGAKRALARVTGRTSAESIDVRSLGDDFRLDGATSASLLSALLAGGMLYPDGTGTYRPTRLFREYALASVVAPLARERAKALVDRACALAASINAEWDNVPFQIETVAVSGSYMTRRELLPELSLSLILCPRPVVAKAAPRLHAEQGRGAAPGPRSDACAELLHRRSGCCRSQRRPASVQRRVSDRPEPHGCSCRRLGPIPRMERVGDAVACREVSPGGGTPDRIGGRIPARPSLFRPAARRGVLNARATQSSGRKFS